MITIYLKVKFRAWKIDLFKFEKTVQLDLSAHIGNIELVTWKLAPFELVLIDERGVYLKVSA